MACEKCGRNKPVLVRARKPQAERFLGMCKDCIRREMDEMRDQAVRQAVDFFKDLFGNKD
jgi:NMD protein affecting ribosome stability and mRNA decay